MKRSHKLGLVGLGLAGAASVIALSATAAPEKVKLTGIGYRFCKICLVRNRSISTELKI